MSHIDSVDDTTGDVTERREAVKPPQPAQLVRPAWQDFARDKGLAAIVYLNGQHYNPRWTDVKPGYYIVEALERDEQGRVLTWGRSCAYNETVEAAQFCLDRWAARFIAGEKIPQDEILQCYSVMLQKGLVRNV